MAEGGTRSLSGPAGRRHAQLLEINSIIASLPDPTVLRARILEYINDEAREGLDDEGERHVAMLCTLMAAAEVQRLASKTERELVDMIDLHNRIRRELHETEDPRRAAAVLARSVVPVLADVCLVDLAEGPGGFRRVAVETSHLVPDARPIREALATPPDRHHAPHDPQVVARTGTARLLPEVSDADLVCASSTPDDLRALRSLNPTSLLCVPLESPGVDSGPGVGAMTLMRVRPSQAFTIPHKHLAQALGEIYHEEAPAATVEPPADRPATAAARTRNGAARSHSGYARPSALDLTPRELEVLNLMNQGYSREALAKRLRISVKTYDNHTIKIRAKLGVDNNLAALAKARAAGIIDLEN
ncbi:hypothetical protein GBA63_22680 (plasmid) [Rubrobacter tropicus]|uniref:HTH luxR-type domain-containing protein n=1 Tax=Rubrobacter tropicus TaxID=2653851 RepID=A0A6G8QG58_9ACTN|nr:helix-turn-helix domain-containing protein [Rubrobacter tropicus]QIN85506.1 hypothetical protein GBA63_22680 [Rubrobacter tropicus]